MTHTIGVPEFSGMKFPMGLVLIFPSVSETILPDDFCRGLTRHVLGDRGEAREDGLKEKKGVYGQPTRLYSIYRDRNGVEYWIVTEADGSVTAVALPGDL